MHPSPILLNVFNGLNVVSFKLIFLSFEKRLFARARYDAGDYKTFSSIDICFFQLNTFGPEKLCAPMSFLGVEANRSFKNMVFLLNTFGPEKLCAPVTFLGGEAKRSLTNMVFLLTLCCNIGKT
jgi:hypothetical protein